MDTAIKFDGLKEHNIASNLLIVFLLLVSSFTPSAVLAEERPNIIYLMADDLGFADLSPERMPRSYELLRERGTQLNFYTMQNCAPTRAALLTGKHPSELGVVGVNSPAFFDGIPVSEVLFPEILQQSGYRTAIFGKWHLGLDESQSPLNNGFDEFLGFTHGWINYYGPQRNGLPYPDGSYGHDHHGAHDFQLNGVPFYTGSYSTSLFSQAAQQYIRKQARDKLETNGNSPFFVYVPFNAPHGPYASPRRYAEELMDEYGISEEELALLYEYEDEVLAIPYNHEIDKETHSRLSKLLFYGSVRALDDAIADIYEALVETDQADNTFFMFASDNGAGIGSRRHGDNGIMRGGKGTPYEGGHRVANLLIWPDKISPNHQVGISIWVGDLYETFLAAAGIEFENPALASNNVLAPLLAGSNYFTRKHGGQHIVPHISKGTYNGNDIAFWAINNNNLKYIRKLVINPILSTTTGISEELYDLKKDPGEQSNLIDSPGYAFALNRMRSKYVRFGGDAHMISLPSTRGGGWGEFELPQEWGFPSRVFDADELLYTDLF